MSKRIAISEAGPIATVTLNRPEKRNALDVDMLQAIAHAGRTLAGCRNIRCVILTGAGTAFSTGLDTASFPQLMQIVQRSGGIMARTHGAANLFQYAAMVWRDLPMPVIAAVHGYAFGGAFQIMLGADMRIAAPDTEFSIMEGKWGLVPDMGGIALMRRLAREDVIRRLTYTAEIFETSQALDWGFITEMTADPVGRAHQLAAQIAAKSPDAVRAAKALISKSAGMTDSDVLLLESQAQGGLIARPNQMEAVMAGLEKRIPEFRDPDQSD